MTAPEKGRSSKCSPAPFLSAKSRSARSVFPRYDGFFGKLVARFLNGEFGPLDAVDAHFSALLYAGDRYEAKPRIESELAAGRTVLADRYIGSNLAHQGARVRREERGEFLDWLKKLEYEIYALPAEDLVIYLRVPVAEAHRLVGQKGRATTRSFGAIFLNRTSLISKPLRKSTTSSRSSPTG